MRSIVSLFVATLILISCDNEEEKVHTITSFSPEAGLEGTQVTIQGTGFSEESGKSIVKLAGETLTVLSATSTTIVVEIPEGSRTGRFSVTIGDKVVYTDKEFTVQHLPVAQQVIYTEGPVGTETFIYVNHGGDTPAKNTLKIGNTPVQITEVSVVQNPQLPYPTQVIDFIIPNGSSGPLTLSYNGLEGTLIEHFRIYPIIDSFSPKGGVEGDIITITGKNFSSTLSENIVKLDNPNPLVLVSATPTEIKAFVPANARFGRLSVDYSSGPMFAKDYFVGPVLYSFNPVTGPVGTMVNVYPFFPMPGITPPVVKFNGTAATEIDLSDGIKARVPANATTGKITITHNGFTTTSSSNFTIQ